MNPGPLLGVAAGQSRGLCRSALGGVSAAASVDLSEGQKKVCTSAHIGRRIGS